MVLGWELAGSELWGPGAEIPWLELGVVSWATLNCFHPSGIKED